MCVYPPRARQRRVNVPSRRRTSAPPPSTDRRANEKRLGENLRRRRARSFRFQAVRESNDFGVFLKSRRGDSATDDRAALTSTCEEDTVKTHAFFFSLFFSLHCSFVTRVGATSPARTATAETRPSGFPWSIERDENLTGTRSLFFAPRADRARTPRWASPALHASTRRTCKIRFLPRGS